MKSSLKKSSMQKLTPDQKSPSRNTISQKLSSKKNDSEDSDLQMTNINNNTTSFQTFYYRGYPMTLVSDYLKELEKIREIIIEPRLDFKELLSCCLVPNRYNVFYINQQKEKKYLFKYKEISSCCCRFCCPNSIRSFKLNMFHMLSSNKEKDLDYKKLIAIYERPFEFTICCCNRPIIYEIKKKNREMEGFEKGFIIDVYNPSPLYYVYNKENILRWKIYAEYCQCGIFCNCATCGKCFEVDFWIFDGRANHKKDKPEGNIRKIFKGISDFDIDTDCFLITFPKAANPLDKIDLITATIMIDYRYFQLTDFMGIEIV